MGKYIRPTNIYKKKLIYHNIFNAFFSKKPFFCVPDMLWIACVYIFYIPPNFQKFLVFSQEQKKPLWKFSSNPQLFDILTPRFRKNQIPPLDVFLRFFSCVAFEEKGCKQLIGLRPDRIAWLNQVSIIP